MIIKDKVSLAGLVIKVRCRLDTGVGIAVAVEQIDIAVDGIPTGDMTAASPHIQPLAGMRLEPYALCQDVVNERIGKAVDPPGAVYRLVIGRAEVVVVVTYAHPSGHKRTQHSIVVVAVHLEEPGVLIERTGGAVLAEVIVEAVDQLDTGEILAVDKVILAGIPAVVRNTVDTGAELVGAVLANALIVHTIDVSRLVVQHAVVRALEQTVVIKLVRLAVDILDTGDLLTADIVILVADPAVLRLAGGILGAVDRAADTSAQSAVGRDVVEGAVDEDVLAVDDLIVGRYTVQIEDVVEDTAEQLALLATGGNKVQIIAVFNDPVFEDLILGSNAVIKVGITDHTGDRIADRSVIVDVADLAVLDDIHVGIDRVARVNTVDIKFVIENAVVGQRLAVGVYDNVRLTFVDKGFALGHKDAVYIVDLIAEAVEERSVDGIAVLVTDLAVGQGVALEQLAEDRVAVLIVRCIVDNAGIARLDIVGIHP